MDPKTASPEEKLLTLIRGKGASPTAGAAPERSTGAAASSGASASGKILGLAWAVPASWLRAMNVGFGLLVCVEVVGWVWLLMTPEPSMDMSVLAPPPPDHAAARPGEPSSPEADPASAGPSLSTVPSRPLFQTVETPASPAGPSAGARPSDEAKALAARLTLLGIVAGDPAQAIIEDAQTKKTFFVTVGQSVIEGLVVADVRENRVILELGSEKIELSL